MADRQASHAVALDKALVSPMLSPTSFIVASNDDAAPASLPAPDKIGPVMRADLLGGASSLVSGFNPVAFGSPWLLLGLGALPLLWLMFKRTPPVPKAIPFPPLKMLFGLKSKDDKPASMPVAHRLLRLAAAALVVGAVAKPMFNPEHPVTGDGPVLLVVDNDWAAAKHWPARLEAMKNILDHAGNRPVLILGTAPDETGGTVRLSEPLSAQAALEAVQKMQPMPWLPDDKAALETLQSAKLQGRASVLWLSDGLQHEGARDLARQLQEIGALTVIQDPAKDAPYLIAPADRARGTMSVTVRRADGTQEAVVTLIASDEHGLPVGPAEARFAAGKTEATATFSLPDERLDQIMQVSVKGENNAGATALVDERWRRRPVGMIEDSLAEPSEILLSGSNYVKQALDPYADLRTGTVDRLLQHDLSVMVMTDAANLNDAARAKVDDWVQKGGLLMRFAGPHLAANPDDSLLPVPLRERERVLGAGPGGPQSWNKTEGLMPFKPGSPFAGIEIPKDVQITRQVLAQPVPDLDSRTWASLEDGTPLVTAQRHGEGWIVLVHTTASPEWSNLALNGGLFIDMLRAIVAQSQATGNGPDNGGAMPAWKTLDGQGRLGDPPATAHALPPGALDVKTVGPQNPPGFYGSADTRRALNLGAVLKDLEPLGALPDGVKREVYAKSSESDLTGPLLLAAMILLGADLALALKYNGAAPRKKPQSPSGPKVS